MRYSKKLINALILLEKEEKVYSKDLGKLSEELYQRGHLKTSYRGQFIYYQVRDVEAFKLDLVNIDESFRDLSKLLALYEKGDNLTRSDMASYTGDSKIKRKRSFEGFLVNSYTDIPARIGDDQIQICPSEGTFTFIADWKLFSIPEDVVIIGIENPENFRYIRKQKCLFENAVSKVVNTKSQKILFVSRYPQENSSSDLRNWLMSVPNKYIHYGDYDLAGINVFHTEYYNYLGARSSFLIPENIEQLIIKGSRKRFDRQYKKYKDITSPLTDVQDLINLIKRHKHCYDQEGLERQKEGKNE